MKRAGRHAIGLAALLCLPALLGAQVVIYTENWNSGAAWNLESGYYLAYNNLLTDNGDSDTTIPAHLRYHSDMPTQDYSVQSAMSCATFWPDQYHGYQTMVYHYLRDNGSNTWYEVQYEMGAVWLNKVQSGSRTYLAYYYGGTYTCGPLLSAIAGGTITVSLNGTQMISYTDPSPITSGRPGVGTMNTNPFNWDMSNCACGVGTTVLAYTDTIPPSTPANVVSVPYAARVHLGWSPSTDNSNQPVTYNVYRKDSSGGSFYLLASTAGPPFADPTVRPSSTYWYEVAAVDQAGNVSTPSPQMQVATLSTVNAPPDFGTSLENLSSWGAGPEKISMLTGALRLSIPLAKFQQRSRGPGVNMVASYTSQFWSNDAAGTRMTAIDSGYGTGFSFQVGALVPVFAGTLLIRYDFLDNSAVIHHLLPYQGSTTIYRSEDSTYLELNTNGTYGPTIYFVDGTYWVFGCTSVAPEPDGGTLYPTRLEDSNGNIISITYMAGSGQSNTNTSGRIVTVVDSLTTYRWTYSGTGFMFNYAWIYLGWHVASVTHTANGQNFTDAAFTYNNGSYYAATLVSPFGTALNGQPIPVAQLTGITFTGAPGQGGYTFTYNANGELTEVVFPHLGYFRYQYAEADFSSPPRATREVANRYIAANGYVAGNGGAPTEQTYSFTHPSDPNVASHINTTLQDASGNRKVWYFNQGSANGWDNGLEYQMDTQQGPSFSVLRRTQTGWTQDVTSPAPQPMSNPRVFGVTTALSDGVTQSRHEQDVDTTGLNGNVLAVREYAYGNLTTPYRTTTTTYLATTAYLQYNILNRPTEVKISDSSGTVVSDTTIAYDPSVPTGYLSSPSHDGNYSSVVTRGNPYQITRNGMAYTYTYDLGGNILTVLDPLYHTIQSNTYDSNGSQVVNSSAGGNNSSFVYGYDNDTTLLQQATGSNSDSTSFTYASYRPMSTTFADGTQETYAYLDNIYSNLPAGNPVAQDSISSLGKTTRTTFDGFGRTIRTAVREQTSPQVWITTQTVYAPCSCTPIGKPVQTSRPYRSDNQGNAISPDSAQLTTTTYDALGRPLTVALPDGATTSYNYSVAPDASAGSGAYTLITDPMGKQKGYFYDAFKELIRVDEPDSGGTLLETARYSYDRMGRMTQVQMGIPKVPVTDSGFESGLTGWTVTSGSAATASTAAAHSGSSSLLETATANVSQTFTGLTVGQVYTISAWAQVSGLAAATLVVDDSAGNNQGDTYTFTTNAAWQLLRVGYTVPANGKLRIQLIYGGSTGSVYWDNVSVVAEGSFTYKQTRTFVYNTKGQLTSSTTPEKGLVTYTYNADGTMATKTENTGSKTANPIQTQTLSYFYDSYDRLTSIQSPVGTVKSSYTYDTESNSALNSTNTGGRPAAVKNDGYTWHYSYDIMGRIQKQTLETPVNGSGGTALMMQSQYGFDNDGRMTDLYYPGAVAEVGSLAAGAHYQYAYDILGRASSLSAYGGATLASTPTTLSSAYNAAGQILSWTESSTTLTRVYNAQRGWTTGITAGSALNFAYTFNADGQVTGVTDSVNPAQSASYTYDNLNRLATAATSQWGLSWSYDDFGNRTAQTPTLGTPPQSNLTYDPTSNQITSAGYTFDAGGNLTAFPNTALSGTPTTSIAYDVFDRASTITTGSSSTTAKYDVFGHRVQQAFSGGITRVYFYNSGGQLLAEYDAPAAGNAPTRIKNYFSGQTVGQWTDRVGSKRADSASTSHYYPYGEEITSTNNDTYKFAQTYRDSSSGLDYAGYRYYASVIGRFATPDPTSSAGKRTPQSWNGYGYAGGDPVNNADPNGTCYSYVDAQGFIDTVGCDVDFNTNLPDFGFAANFAIQIAAAIAAINNAFGSSGNSGNGNGTFTPAPFPAYLVVEYDCYKKPREGQAAVRQITYWLFDSDGSRDTQGTITEIVTPTQGASKTGNNGVFVDQQTLFLPSAPPNNIAQSFWVTLPNGAQYNVFVRGFGGDFGTLGIYRTQKDISINGNIGGAIDSRTGVFRPNAICGDTGVL